MASRGLKKVKRFLAAGKLEKFLANGGDPTVKWPVNFEKAVLQAERKKVK